MRKLTHLELVARQKEITGGGGSKRESLLPLTVVLNNIRSLYNVGSIFRTCDAVGVEKLWLCGITGHPPDGKISKTALGAEETVPWEHSWDACAVLRSLKEQGYQIIFLEQMKESVPYQDFEPKSRICLVVGNEIEGVSDELLSLGDAAIEIEMAGSKNSLNVTVAFGVAAYHLRNCLKVSCR